MKKVLKMAARTLPTVARGEFLSRTAKFQLIISLLGSAVAYAQPNMALLMSPAGEFIGQGQTYYTTNAGDISISGTASAVTLTALGFTSTVAGPGGTALTVGQYSNLVQYPFNGAAPGLNVSGLGRNCTNVCGSFQVLELETNETGQITHFWATFSQDSNCNKPPLMGELRYNSLLATNGALPRTLRVPEDFPTIQSAVNDVDRLAVDTVLVGPGLYQESVQLGTNNVHLVSSGGPTVTAIMAPPGESAVGLGIPFVNVAADSLLSGFTLTNSTYGIYVAGSFSPTVVSNVVVNCGIGIECNADGISTPAFAILRSNVVTGCSGVGIQLYFTAAPVIEGNLVEGNVGAIRLWSAGTPEIRNNIVRDNFGHGIDAGLTSTDANISQNLIVNNTGYGVVFPGGVRGPWIINNTIAGNGLAGIAKDGSANDIRIINNIVVGDPAFWNGNDVIPATIQFNDFYSRTGAALSGLITNVIGIDGNISANPFFACEPSEDFHLVAASPAIDAGTNGAVLLSASDLDGRPRILPGHTNGLSTVDLGAFEFDPAAPFFPCFFLICSSNIVVMAAPGQDSAVVNYPAPFATPGATVTTSPDSGSVFPAGDNPVNVSAQFGTNVTNCTFTITVITDHDLARALNATNLPWVSFGDVPWFAQNGTTHDGIAAAQSGPLTNIQTSTLRTVLQGPGPLSFWWKGPLPGYDNLSFTVDGATWTNISGVPGWQFNTFNMPSGPHIVDWKLARGETFYTGQVAAWLDQVSYPVGPIPLVLVCPSNMVVVAAPGQYSAIVNYPPPFATPGATVTASPPAGSVFPGGDTTVNVTAVYGTNTTNCSFTVTVRTPYDLPLALNTTNINWITAGDASWYMETNVTHDGIAAQSGAITNNQASILQTTLTGPGTLAFWWKVSSQANHALLYVTANGSTQAAISGQVDWQPYTVYLGSGTQLVQWTYAKDASASAGQDAGWLDEVSWTPGAVAPVITSQPSSLAVGTGMTATFSVIAAGTPPFTYQWLFNGEALPGATGSALAVTNVQAWNAGSYSVVVMNQVGTNYSSTATLKLAEVLAWGVNIYGQTNVPADLANVAAIAGGWNHSMVLSRDGTVTVWGSNNHGQTNVPAGLSNVVAIASRSGDLCMALRTNGTVVVWGDNSYGETNVPPGLSNVVAISAGGYGCLALKSDATAVGWGNLTVPAGLSNLVAVSAGDSASLFLRANGTVAAAGTTVPPYVTNIVQIAAGGLHNLALRADGTVVGWGQNSYGQISVPPGLTQVVAIAAGDYHSTALRADHTVVVWGRYYTGGYGNNGGFIVPAVPATLTNVQAIAAGSDHDLALITNALPVPFITGQPVSQTIVAGSNATFNVTAGPTGSGLSYQWRLNSSNSIPYATNSTLVLSNVQSANAGAYSVQVTNAFGSALSSNATLLVEHPPVADASATPSTVISTNSADATVILDGSRSSDPDGDALQYLWLSLSPQPPTVLTNGVVAVVVLPLGVHPLALVVNDGLLASTNPITVSVFTPSQAVVHLNTLVTQSVSNSAPLTAILQSAQAALSRGDSVAAVNQLLAFQKMVRVQVAPSDPALAEELISAAQQIIDSLQDRRGMRPTNLRALNQQAGGKLQLRFSGTTGQIYIVEASTNLLDWAMIGIASQQDDGEFHFEDANAARLPNRFYRVLKP